MFDAVTAGRGAETERVIDEPRGFGLAPARFDDRVCRLFDIFVATVAIAFTSPLMLALIVVVWMSDGGPVFFGHQRIGRDGRRFRCLKFRSMMVDADERLAALLANDPVARAEWNRDHKLRQDPRVTPVGRFLRRSR
jgi:lipopolysaccharide/colanic/teichoic acid biosynthesis glycosyltransferase